jgi:hypothetical protein
MTSAVKSESENKTFKSVLRIGALVSWLGVGFFISNVLNDLFNLAEQPQPINPAILIFAMFALSTQAVAIFWFGKPINRLLQLPSAGALKARFVEATTDDASMDALHGESFR